MHGEEALEAIGVKCQNSMAVKTIQKLMHNLLSTKFITAKVGPMLSSVLKVFRLSLPSLKATIARACQMIGA